MYTIHDDVNDHDISILKKKIALTLAKYFTRLLLLKLYLPGLHSS